MRNFVAITNIRTYKSMKKFILDLTVKSVTALSDKHVLIKLTDDKPLPEMLPGQFVEVRVDQSPSTFLRRPSPLILLIVLPTSCGSLWPPLAMAPAVWLS